MLPRNLARITEDDLSSLIENSVAEGKTIEYKQVLPGGNEEQRKEFLTDAASFANAGGGEIIYGVRAEEGIAKELVGVGDVDDVDGDAEIARLENMLRDGIEPRISGCHAVGVAVAGGHVIVLRIPQSWAGPHMVKFRGSQRFCSRNSNGKYPLDVFEIRDLFLSSGARADRVRDFRLERIARITAGEAPVPLPDGPRTALHIVPLSPPAGGVDVRLAATGRTRLRPMYCRGADSRYNLEGLLAYKTLDGQRMSDGYTQLYRNGVIEAVECRYLASDDRIWGTSYERMVIDECGAYMGLLMDLGVPAPAVVLLTILGARGLAVQTGSNDTSHVIDRDDLLLPAVTIEDLPEIVSGQLSQDVAKVLRPCFDALWNSAGYSQCLDYDENGEWAPRG